MTQTIAVPLWLLIVILLFAAVTFASHFLFPSVRWYLRRRMERVVAKLNQRLQRPIEPFKLARRYDMIQRLAFDPEVAQAVSDYAQEAGVPENVAFEKARRYASEIVPSFSATVYFSVVARITRWVSRALFRVRLGNFDAGELRGINRDATVIFVINHRSNMDYFLVTYLVSQASTISYAAGEWARVWPLSTLARMMGAYFIRRQKTNALYRTVLQRYVQMATQGGVTQAIFLEGRLSLDGATAPAKLGLLGDIVATIRPGARDVVFVPVALNYDRVIEDTFLIRAGQTGVRRYPVGLFKIIRVASRYFWQRVTFSFRLFGTAMVSFGRPLELAGYIETHGGDGEAATPALGQELMGRIKQVIPVLPVPLVATCLLEGLTSETLIAARIGIIKPALAAREIMVPRREPPIIARDGLDLLEQRGLIRREGDRIVFGAEIEPVLHYYRNSIAHHLDAAAAEISASAG